MSFTHFALLAKFGDVNIPLEKCSLEYFGIAPRKANEKACLQDLPVPAYKLGGQRSPWFVNAQKLADFIDKKMADAQNDWERIRA
ncbi:pyocin activator PrtN family protein [Comamonas sp.]|uniref:pyocin activator PrtN family protein n=1 Tax=Comamonas sp. TaxID=34028 RepID=UPI002FC76E06